jgi:hypothetical protein
MQLHELKEYLQYAPETGEFKWLKARAKRNKVGEVAGYCNGRGRWEIGIDGESYLAHRLAWYFVYGEWPDKQIDNIDGDIVNNAISNLRLATNSENKQNIKKAQKNNKSGFLGVFYSRGRYVAQIALDGVQKYLGSFDTPEEAHKKYLEVKRKIHTFCTI